MEQLTEGIAKVTVVLLAILILPVPDWMRHGAIVLAGFVALSTVALFVLAGHHEWLEAWAARGERSEERGARVETQRARPSLLSRLPSFLATWASRLEALRTPRRFLAALLACYAMKLVEGLAIVAAQHALGIHLPMSTAVLILAAAGLGTMVPLAPGSLGTYEASVFLAYRWLGVPAADALTVSIVQHLAYLAASAGAGYAVLSARQLRGVRVRGT